MENRVLEAIHRIERKVDRIELSIMGNGGLRGLKTQVEINKSDLESLKDGKKWGQRFLIAQLLVIIGLLLQHAFSG